MAQEGEPDPGRKLPLQQENSGTTSSLSKASKRKANVYDAVAGDVTQAGFVGHFGDPKASKQPLRPDEILFKRANAPVRYEEKDYYYAHESLSATQSLPDGSLLESIHAYISSLYSRLGEAQHPSTPWKSMDESALIALGILMEETAGQVLGSTGDLALTEAIDGVTES
ncbi:hypothetical protein ACN47E_002356 [Coniothyrium glycines]